MRSGGREGFKVWTQSILSGQGCVVIHCQARTTEGVQMSFRRQGGDTMFMTIFLNGNLQNEVFQLVFTGFNLLIVWKLSSGLFSLNNSTFYENQGLSYGKEAKQLGRAEC